MKQHDNHKGSENQDAHQRQWTCVRVVPSVSNISAPSRSVRATLAPSSSYRRITTPDGWWNLLWRPTEMATHAGRTAATKGAELLVMLP